VVGWRNPGADYDFLKKAGVARSTAPAPTSGCSGGNPRIPQKGKARGLTAFSPPVVPAGLDQLLEPLRLMA